MSHEPRTPLNAIIGYSEMLLEDGSSTAPAEVEADLGKIQTAGRYLLGLINDVLDLSRSRQEDRAEPRAVPSPSSSSPSRAT
jgi:signal transduction histidine kinase